MLKHVKPAAIVMLVSAGVAAILGIVSVVATVLVAMSPDEFAADPGGKRIGVAMYAGLALYTLAAGGVQAAAGWNMLRFRGRKLAIGASIFGMLGTLPCCCFPLSVGAGVYTLVLMFNAEVKQAFDLAESHGWSADQILAHFGYGAASGRASGGPPSGGGQSGGGQGAPPAGGSQPPPPRSFGGPPSGGPPPPRSL